MVYLIILMIILFVCYTMLIIYYRYCWVSFPIFKVPSNPILKTKISVIIPARNEEQNIAKCLNSLIAQSYPKRLFEVLVVDDFSTDKTTEMVLAQKDNGIKLILLKDFAGDENLNSYKKKAIAIAIAQATGDLIVTTDADCTARKDWLLTIAALYEKDKPAFIAAPVAIKSDHRFLSVFQALDFMALQGITGASVYKKKHSMCNGANLAYEKKAFYEVDGFKNIDTIASGDDMLLMHKIYKRYPDRVLFLKSKEAIVTTLPAQSVKDFINQRIRWASKADKYDDKRIFAVLLLVYCFNFLLTVLPVIFIFNDIPILISGVSVPKIICWLLVLVFKTIIEIYFLIPVARFFGTKKMLWLFPIAQPLHILYTVVAGWLGKFGTYEWKGRQVK